MDTKTIAGYVGSAIAIGIGVALLYVPPAVLAGEASTVGWAASFITGGLAGVGISVAIPNVVRTAKLAGAAEAETDRRARLRRVGPPKGQGEMVAAQPE